MKLTFQTPYLSIQSFPEITLPSFTLITGVNGTGKTHLLRAIENGQVRTDITDNWQEEIKYFDWSTLVPQNTGNYQFANVYKERDQIINSGREQRKTERDAIHTWAVKYNLVGKVDGSISTFLRLSRNEYDSLISDPPKAELAWKEMEAIKKRGFDKIKHQNRKNPNLLTKLEQLRTRFGGGVLALEEKDFEDEPFGWGQTDIFQQSFAQLFTSYFELKKQNLLKKLDENEGRTPVVSSLSDKEFRNRYGEEPWFFVNRVLSDARLDFEINYPTEYSATTFTPQLRKISNGVELQFSELSSGERILMSFAFCLYYSLDIRQETRRPKVLLLDEIDAPLHPSMSRQLIETIRNTLVQEQGINVLLATHSPSTVAVAPEESVYVMRSDSPGLHKVGKHQAISILTSEIPTLSIDFSGRRQVFVESKNDEDRYEKLYRFLGPYIESERSLTFIAAGKKKHDGDIGGGCDNVKRIVEDLFISGNERVYGLVDWDKKNVSTDRVIVLSERKRYAVENCLLDPLLVGLLTIRTNHAVAQSYGISDEKSYPELKDITEDECQQIIDSVEQRVLELPTVPDNEERQTVCYVCGYSLKVSTQYLMMQGHELEDKVKEGLPILKKYHNQGELLMSIIEPVIMEFGKFAPVDFVEAFKRILDDDPNNYSLR